MSRMLLPTKRTETFGKFDDIKFFFSFVNNNVSGLVTFVMCEWLITFVTGETDLSRLWFRMGCRCVTGGCALPRVATWLLATTISQWQLSQIKQTRDCNFFLSTDDVTEPWKKCSVWHQCHWNRLTNQTGYKLYRCASDLLKVDQRVISFMLTMSSNNTASEPMKKRKRVPGVFKFDNLTKLISSIV